MSVLKEFFHGRYEDCRLSLYEATLTTPAAGLSRDQWEAFAVSCFQHCLFDFIDVEKQPKCHESRCGIVKTFTGIDETGYDFYWAEGGVAHGVVPTEVSNPVRIRGATWYWVVDHDETAHIKFAEVKQIKFHSGRTVRRGAGGYGSVELLGNAGSTLDSFYFISRKDKKPVLAALDILCKNLNK